MFSTNALNQGKNSLLKIWIDLFRVIMSLNFNSLFEITKDGYLQYLKQTK